MSKQGPPRFGQNGAAQASAAPEAARAAPGAASLGQSAAWAALAPRPYRPLASPWPHLGLTLASTQACALERLLRQLVATHVAIRDANLGCGEGFRLLGEAAAQTIASQPV